jgi:hypothetical protein
LKPPTSPTWVIPAPLPILPGDRVQFLGCEEDLVWRTNKFEIEFDIPGGIIHDIGLGIAWVIEVEYGMESEEKSSPEYLRDEL